MNNMQQKLVTRPGVYIHIYVLTEGRLSARMQEFSSIYAPTPGEFEGKPALILTVHLALRKPRSMMTELGVFPFNLFVG